MVAPSFVVIFIWGKFDILGVIKFGVLTTINLLFLQANIFKTKSIFKV